jgi:SAM-dependent methyltransferase
MTNLLDKSFWDQRWHTGQTGWDLNEASPAIMDYFDRTKPPFDARILIPGCGNAWEAEALTRRGYTDITLCDISPTLCANLSERYHDQSAISIVCGDFFDLSGPYDLVIEQTFLCALDPSLRAAYAEHMARIIRPGSILAGLWFSVEFPFDGPPFGGSPEDYLKLLEPYFNLKEAGPCKASVKPRQGNEWFIVAERKNY